MKISTKIKDAWYKFIKSYDSESFANSGKKGKNNKLRTKRSVKHRNRNFYKKYYENIDE